MTELRRWWWLASGGAAVVLAAGAVTTAYAVRVGPQFPRTEGTPFTITLDDDGCPVRPAQVHFVDSPGQLVDPSPTSVTLCTWIDEDGDGVPEPPGRLGLLEIPPRQRTLAGPAAVEFAGLVNAMPDRNGAWRDWQRRHSGLWPDAPTRNGAWDSDGECISSLMLPTRIYSYVLRYRDRDPVALISTCHGFTDGTRTRLPITYTRPHLVDEFVIRFEADHGQ